MASLFDLFSSQTQWLAERARSYIVAQGHRRHLALLPEGLPLVVAGITTDLCGGPDSPEFRAQPGSEPAPQFAPSAWFTGTAALMLRQCAVPLSVFFCLLKGLRQGYLELLREHISKEDEILYPLAERVLPAERREAIVQGYRKAEEQAAQGLEAHYRAIVEEYERKLG